MTRDEIEKLAGHRTVSPWIMKLVYEAIKIEREACAKLAETLHETSWPDTIASAIRARNHVPDSDTSQERVDKTKKHRHEQEPVAMYEDWYHPNSCSHCGMVGGHTKICRHSTTPPQRTWVGLTKQDVYDLYNKMLAHEGNNIATRYQDFAKYLEAKLKEKNT